MILTFFLILHILLIVFYLITKYKNPVTYNELSLKNLNALEVLERINEEFDFLPEITIQKNEENITLDETTGVISIDTQFSRLPLLNSTFYTVIYAVSSTNLWLRHKYEVKLYKGTLMIIGIITAVISLIYPHIYLQTIAYFALSLFTLLILLDLYLRSRFTDKVKKMFIDLDLIYEDEMVTIERYLQRWIVKGLEIYKLPFKLIGIKL